MGEDFRDAPGSGEKIPSVEKSHVDSADNFMWNEIAPLKIYEQKIWKDHAEHWLTPLEHVAKQHESLTFEFEDTASPGNTWQDIHPSPHQGVLWIVQELQHRLKLSDADIAVYRELSDCIHDLQKRMQFNKLSFELALAKRIDWPKSADHMVWPTYPNGF